MNQIKHRVIGTSVLKLTDIFENVKGCAGTCFSITLDEYNKHENRLCSYSYINKWFYLTWNTILNKSGLKQQIIFRKITQGRKPINKSKYQNTICLRCDQEFLSWDKRNNRICPRCKKIEKQKIY